MDVVGRFREVLPMLEDVGAFESRLKAGCEAGFEAVSRDMERHRNSMKAFGVADDAQVPPLFAMRAFTTPKKDGKTSRLVVDARPINAAMDRPPPMDLPRMRELVADVKRHRYAMQCDGKSYFYQFPLDAGISRYFGIGMKGRHMQMRALCMGWSWAPCIAQRASNVLVRGLGLAWLDNFLVLGQTRGEAERRVAEFRGRIEEARVEVHPEGGGRLWEVTSRFVCVGVEFDLEAEAQRHRLDPAWVGRWTGSGALRRVLADRASARDFAEVFGGAIWATGILSIPRCHFAALLSFASRVGGRMAGEDADAWERGVTVTPSVRRELGALRRMVERNEWVGKGGEDAHEEALWTDASSWAWAALVEVGNMAVDGRQGVFGCDLSSAHINLKEMWALAEGVTQMCWTPGTTTCRVDNAAVVGAVAKGSSSSFVANRVLSRILRIAERRRITLRPQWVPSAEQLADPYTRGVRLPDFPVPLRGS
ncbi:Retrovirus-related Pol polyprotein from transposon 17.6 [Diplonema papillatum]|nr:Retrovirus-related Pol polyprotein from transposon 17.6 [Diplonema papillatum]